MPYTEGSINLRYSCPPRHIQKEPPPFCQIHQQICHHMRPALLNMQQPPPSGSDGGGCCMFKR
ncbi:hypothetical protein ACE6H2_017228 [Prunus campanulata]